MRCKRCGAVENIKKYCLIDVHNSKQTTELFCTKCASFERKNLAGLFKVIEIICDEDCAKQNGRSLVKDEKFKGSPPPT